MSAGRRYQSRPTVIGRRSAVSTPHYLASSAAIEILSDGGNAVDAAVAAAAVSTVVQPWSSSVAGVGWASVYEPATGTVDVLDFHGVVPAGLDPTLLPEGRGGMVDWAALESNGGCLLGSLVPGVAAGWEELVRTRGRLSLARVLEPAIAVAAEGFPVSELLHSMIVDNAARLARWPASSQLYLPESRPRRVGEILVQRDVAATLGRLAANGPAELQTGRTAEALATFYSRHGGALTAGELAGYSPGWMTALEVYYRGHTVLCAPTAVGDVAFALGLQLQDRLLRFAGPGDPDYVHFAIQTARIVAAERSRVLGPNASASTVAELLDPSRADAVVSRVINGTGAGHRVAGGGTEDTITLAVVDSEGRAVNLMQTVGTYFGTAAVVDGTGVLLNSSLYFASPSGATANRIIPGHAVEQNPCLATVLDSTGTLRLVIGSPGGKTRVETVRQMITNVIDFGMSIQEAVDTPRFLAHPDGRTVEFEGIYGLVGGELRRSLESRGHLVSNDGEPAGSGQGVLVAGGVLMAGADWRRESVAVAID